MREASTLLFVQYLQKKKDCPCEMSTCVHVFFFHLQDADQLSILYSDLNKETSFMSGSRRATPQKK